MHAPDLDIYNPPEGKHWLILVRHSLPEISPGMRASLWHLSTEGHQRCDLLAERLSPYGMHLIYTSIESKAVETGQRLGELLSLPTQSFEGLHEHPREAVLTFSEQVFQAKLSAFFDNPDKLVFGEETSRQSRDRFNDAVNALLALNQGKNLGIVAHGTVMTLFVSHTCGVDPLPFWRRLGLPSFIVLSYPDISLHSVVEHIV